MRSADLLGVVLLIAGLVILFLLRDPLVRLVIFILEFLGIFIGFLLIVAGLALILRWRRERPRWFRPNHFLQH